ncbi:hypothetical protein GH5_06732 [Leishmania sp. Ghana 2012 LV757]|uniref:hypothetical protein n=1 Tax=Leishmania sp. Ghana 2012 LV757 TaxID=2803181 RepID=UPI001B692F96|nr:hypothetical protein GH5_06732 [Leishmania sp. Ghana 2012 LV757]
MATLLSSEAPPRMPYQVEDRIRVYGRVRPPASPEAPLWVTVDDRSATLHCGSVERVVPKARALSPQPPPHTENTAQSPSFRLDGVIGDAHHSAARAFFESTAHSCVVHSLLKGTSATVLCCGEKGTGKTTTMFGDAVAHGLCQCILASLFAAVMAQSEPTKPMSRSAMTVAAPSTLSFTSPCAGRAAEEEAERGLCTRYSVQLSCLELRGEHVVDLLVGTVRDAASSQTSSPSIVQPPPSTPSSLSLSARPNISMDPRGNVAVHNVSKVLCCSAADAFALVHQSRRVQSSTASPQALGHVIVVVNVACEEGGEGSAAHHVVRTAQLYLVDLAAAEQLLRRSAKPQMPLPSKSPRTPVADVVAKSHSNRNTNAAIRHSLAALKEVITRLSPSPAEVDSATSTRPLYKQSKLTMLLKGHLGGGCLTLVIAHVRSEEAYKTDTLATLQLARQLLRVPQQPTSRVTEDPFTLVRRLQRQVAALQAEVRLQIEMNTHAVRDVAALAATTPGDVSTALDASGRNRCSGGSSGRGAQRRSLEPLAGRSSDRSASPSQTAGGATGDYHPLLRRTPSSSAIPASTALTTNVVNFVAGRIAVLPITTVLEMHTCFELLRQCVAERDMQLRAALADLRAAESATVTAFTTLSVGSARSSVSEPSAGRPTWAERHAGAGGTGRRRLASMRINGASARDAPAAEGKRHLSVILPQSTGTAQLPRRYSSYTAQLSEPSPSLPARVGGTAGKGYGSAPSAAGLSQDGDRDTVPPSPCPEVFSPSPKWPNAAATATSNPPAAAAARFGARGGMPSDSDAIWGSAHREGSSPLCRVRAVSSAPVSRPCPVSAPGSMGSPSRQASVARQSPTQWGEAPAGALDPSSSIAAHTMTQVLRPRSATLASAADSSPPASSGESHAFYTYTTRTAEGSRQVQYVRREEEALASLRLRLVTEAAGGCSHSGPDLAEECRYHEDQLRRRREALLRNFESWYRTRMLTEQNTASEQDSIVPNPLGEPAADSKRLTLGAMRQRLRPRATVVGAGIGNSYGGGEGLVGGTSDGVTGKATYDRYGGLVSALPQAAPDNEAASEAGAASVASERFTAAGALSTA